MASRGKKKKAIKIYHSLNDPSKRCRYLASTLDMISCTCYYRYCNQFNRYCPVRDETEPFK